MRHEDQSFSKPRVMAMVADGRKARLHDPWLRLGSRINHGFSMLEVGERAYQKIQDLEGDMLIRTDVEGLERRWGGSRNQITTRADNKG